MGPRRHSAAICAPGLALLRQRRNAADPALSTDTSLVLEDVRPLKKSAVEIVHACS
jgi:hypothetical protein